MHIQRIKKDFKRYKGAYLIALPIVIYYLVFHYRPMVGILIAFQDFRPRAGIWGSEWVGLQHFKDFFSSFYFTRVLGNTLTISIATLIFSFPAPILLALLLNELKNEKFKKVVQTVSYMPHFISLVIICGLVKIFVGNDGPITHLVSMLTGLPEISLLTRKEFFVPIHVISGIWSGIGYGSIIYLAALSGIDQQLYDAAAIDGAGRWRQTLHVTLPGIAPTIITMLLLRIGNLLDLSSEKVILLYNEGIYETSDIISTFVYRKGLLDYEWSYSTAVGLFNAVVNFALVVIANKISKKVSEVSLW